MLALRYVRQTHFADTPRSGFRSGVATYSCYLRSGSLISPALERLTSYIRSLIVLGDTSGAFDLLQCRLGLSR
jgi:hypothetical protein